MLSKRVQDKVQDFGSEGERVCYVRLKGPTTRSLFFIVVYVPHRGRVDPCQDDTLHDLEAVLNRVPQGDCIWILGDFNEQLEENVKGRTGRWVGGIPSQNSEKIIQLLRLHELNAVNTMFPPRYGKEVHTFLHTAQQGGVDQVVGRGKDQGVNDYGEYVGSYCKAKYKGK